MNPLPHATDDAEAAPREPHRAPSAPDRPTLTVPLWRAAHGRTGDKGDRSNISVIAWDPRLYPLLVEQLTPEVVARHFAHRQPGAVTCHALPRLHALNVVIDGVLDGGVTASLNLDSHGKALSFHLLALPLQVPRSLADALVDPSLADALAP